VALVGAIATAERTAYPRAAWQGLGLLAEVERRLGRARDAEATTARRRALVAGVAAGLDDGALRAAFLAGGG
jgi:hypothetical protein